MNRDLSVPTSCGDSLIDFPALFFTLHGDWITAWLALAVWIEGFVIVNTVHGYLIVLAVCLSMTYAENGLRNHRDYTTLFLKLVNPV